MVKEKRIKLCMFILLFCSFGIINAQNHDPFKCSCMYSDWDIVFLDENTGRYHDGMIELGLLGYEAKFTECSLKDSIEIEISGFITGGVKDKITPIFLARETSKFELEVIDTLTITDKKGNFKIVTKLDDGLFFIIKDTDDRGSSAFALKNILDCD